MASTDTEFVEQMIPTLSTLERQVLMLRYAEELTTTEIGLVLKISALKVEEVLHEVRSRTREALAVRAA